jgi:diguanylate cyclase (GGDEF)-like protein
MFHRAAFLALAERDWLRAGRYGGAVALMVVEIDRLRQMTDQAGPRVADALLAGLGRQVLASLRAADLLARFEDAQLAVFLPQADSTGALDVADRIRDMVEHLQLPGLPGGARFSASVGVAVLRPLHQPLSALVGLSQQALQQARHAGGNCVRSASPDGPWLPTFSDPPAADGNARPARPGESRD